MEEVIRKYFQCWLDKDIDAVKEIFSDDIIYSECYGPVYKGIGQIIRWFEDWNQKGTVLQWDIKRVVVSGNTAVVEWFFQCDYEGNVDGFDGVTIDIMPQEEAKKATVTQVGTARMGDLIVENL